MQQAYSHTNQQLINTLRHTINTQQQQISDLEHHLRTWEKKYRESFFRNGEEEDKNLHFSYKQFNAQLVSIQQKYSQKIKLPQSTPLPVCNIKQILQLIDKLYEQIHISHSNITSHTKTIEQQQFTITDLNTRLQSFKESFQIALQRSQKYQEQLLLQIHKLQSMNNRHK